MEQQSELSGRSIVFYTDITKKWILKFKYGDQTQYAKLLAAIMFNRIGDSFDDIDCIVPVPIHFLRLMRRLFNQSTLLANELGYLMQKPVFYNVLYKNRYTKPQGHLSVIERQQNIADSFSIKNQHMIKDKTVLLIDDVWTTGATLTACSEVLRANGCKKVKYLTFARASLAK